ncbi:MAG: SDR family oxidoreductase [Cyanobacteria bacterium J06614_10]
MPKTALITGASSGIGRAFAQVFAQHHYTLILVARSQDKLLDLQQTLSAKHGITVIAIPQDLTEPNAAQQIFDQVEQQGLIVDVLINNAGIGDYGEFAAGDWDKLQSMILLNVLALTQLSHLYLPGMLARGQGKILNVASTAAFQPGPMMAVYFATKAYVLSLSEAIAAETAGTGVTVTVLCPGPTQSNFADTANMGAIAAMENVSADNFPTALTVANYGYRMLEQEKVVAVHGLLNKLLAFSPRITPRSLIRNGIMKFMAAGKADS